MGLSLVQGPPNRVSFDCQVLRQTKLRLLRLFVFLEALGPSCAISLFLHVLQLPSETRFFGTMPLLVVFFGLVRVFFLVSISSSALDSPFWESVVKVGDLRLSQCLSHYCCLSWRILVHLLAMIPVASLEAFPEYIAVWHAQVGLCTHTATSPTVSTFLLVVVHFLSLQCHSFLRFFKKINFYSFKISRVSVIDVI